MPVGGVAIQEKLFMSSLTVQGGAEVFEERILSLHTEMCESGEVTAVEEEHDEASSTT